MESDGVADIGRRNTQFPPVTIKNDPYYIRITHSPRYYANIVIREAPLYYRYSTKWGKSIPTHITHLVARYERRQGSGISVFRRNIARSSKYATSKLVRIRKLALIWGKCVTGGRLGIPSIIHDSIILVRLNAQFFA